LIVFCFEWSSNNYLAILIAIEGNIRKGFEEEKHRRK